MPPRRSYKSDESFLTYLAMGASGVCRVSDHLRAQGHEPMELERGSSGFKIWRDPKPKAIRVPDIVCLKCGQRVESRAKAEFELVMSHSPTKNERAWDFGLGDQDAVAIVVCHQVGLMRPIDWQAEDLVQYATVGDMRKVWETGRVDTSRRKGSGEGSEVYATWPTQHVPRDGVITAISATNVQYRPAGGRAQSRSVNVKGISLPVLVNVGEEVRASQVVASLAPMTSILPCTGQIDPAAYLHDLLLQPTLETLSYRYTAAKVLPHLSVSPSISEKIIQAYKNKLLIENEHIYVLLESAAALARQGIAEGWQFIEGCLYSSVSPETQLEGVITLGEIKSKSSIEMLVGVVNNSFWPSGVRAGASWALGEVGDESVLDVLVSTLNDPSDEIKIESTRALAKLGRKFGQELVTWFRKAPSDLRPGIAWALAQSGALNLEELLALSVDQEARTWVVYILGTEPEERYSTDLEHLKQCDFELYLDVSLFRQLTTSWVFDLEEFG